MPGGPENGPPMELLIKISDCFALEIDKGIVGSRYRDKAIADRERRVENETIFSIRRLGIFRGLPN